MLKEKILVPISKVMGYRGMFPQNEIFEYRVSEMPFPANVNALDSCLFYSLLM